MARSNRSTSSSRSNTSTRRANRVVTAQPVAETRVVKRREITNYTFDYRRDRVSRRAGSSYLQIAGNDGDVALTMTLQEAQSLYRFLHNALN